MGLIAEPAQKRPRYESLKALCKREPKHSENNGEQPKKGSKPDHHFDRVFPRPVRVSVHEVDQPKPCNV
jgi:hypothetical protein